MYNFFFFFTATLCCSAAVSLQIHRRKVRWHRAMNSLEQEEELDMKKFYRFQYKNSKWRKLTKSRENSTLARSWNWEENDSLKYTIGAQSTYILYAEEEKRSRKWEMLSFFSFYVFSVRPLTSSMREHTLVFYSRDGRKYFIAFYSTSSLGENNIRRFSASLSLMRDCSEHEESLRCRRVELSWALCV